MNNKIQGSTKLVHSGTERSQFGEISEALFLTQSYKYETAESALARFSGEDTGFIYSRYSNPTTAMLENRIADYEGAEDCFATASGMAAAFASLACQLQAGDHIVSAKALFSSCYHIISQILPKWGVEVSFVDGLDLTAWEAAIRPNTKLFFAEAMSNPRLELLDIASIKEIAKPHNIKLLIDNVFVTPVLQKSLALGADMIFTSATKHIDGQGRVLGGLILGQSEFIRGPLETFIRHTGASMSPFNAWVLLKSLETLELRVEKQCKNARHIAQWLSEQDEVNHVIYPELANYPQKSLAQTQLKAGGTMVSFEIHGGQAEAFAFLNKLNILSISNNLGDAKSLITHPATTTHYKLSDEEKRELQITPSLLRLSVGIEHEDDLIADLSQALKS